MLPWNKAAADTDYGHLLQKFGAPYCADEKGKFAALNESFRAGLYADENIVLYEPDERSFYTYDADFAQFSPKFYSRNASPIVFDPAAKCERFLNELVSPAVHPDDVILLQKFAGMCLLGYNRAQRILILDGETGRGKTQFANVMQGIIGHVNCAQLRTKHLGERFETFRFLKKTLLAGVDVEPDFLATKGAAVLKGFVGGDWFDAEMTVARTPRG